MKKQAVRRSERQQFGIRELCGLLLGVALAMFVIKAVTGVDTTDDGHPTASFVDDAQRDVVDAQMQCQGGLLRRYANGSLTRQRLAEGLGDIAEENFTSCN